MLETPKLLLSKPFSEGSEYIIELYDNGEMHILNNGQRTIITAEELNIYDGSPSNLELFFNNLTQIRSFKIDENGQTQIWYNNANKYETLLNNEDTKKLITEFENDIKAIEDFWRILEDKYNNSNTNDQIIDYKDFYQLYSLLENHIISEIERAKNEGKLALIVGCEEHYSEFSFFCEMMIAAICLKKGINHLMLESNKQDLKDLMDKFNSNLPIEEIRKNAAQCAIAKLYHLSSNSNFHPIDPFNNQFKLRNDFNYDEYREDNKCGWKTRQDGIHNSIAKVNQSSLLLIGGNHVPQIIDDHYLNKIFNIIPINLIGMNIKFTSNTFAKLKLLDKLLKNEIVKNTDHELFELQQNHEVDLDVFKSYVKDKKTNIEVHIHSQFYNSEKVLQVPNLVQIGKMSFLEGFEMTLKAIQHHHDPNNSGGAEFMTALETILVEYIANDYEPNISGEFVNSGQLLETVSLF